MPLSAGDRLGPYEITGELGAGGMGIVLRARDTKLDRDVALKVLPEAFTSDPDRLARFEREAKVLASLNHPNIGSIYGLEEAEGGKFRALILELVEGPTLADRISRAPILLDEALPIAKQIAEALEAAHEAGVIHRDLKPANIKVRNDGTVKVLDFGLAKALDPNPEGDPSQSPTLTVAATQMGVIMGTATYMSPEQARGQPVDKRADIWAFGVVLYEMVTGRRPFEGRTVSDTLASVLAREPDLETLPTAVRRLLRRCFEKEPRKRLRDIAEGLLQLEEALTTPPEASSAPAPPAPQLWQRPVPALIVVLLVAAITGLAVWSLMRPGPAGLVRFTIVPPDTAPFSSGPTRPGIVISRDGTQVVYRGRGGGLNLRPIDQLVGAPLRGGERGVAPFVSPDGEWVGFTPLTSLTNLEKVSIFGGPSVMVAESPNSILGASWGADDQIIFGTGGAGLFRVSGGGGEPEELTTIDGEQGETSHRWPSIIPSREAVLFVIGSGATLATAQLAVLDLATTEVMRLGLAGVSPHYVSTGHLVYAAEDGSIRAVPFDAASLEVTGNPVPLVEGVRVKATGAADFSISDNGRLVYALGAGGGGAQQALIWVDREGQEELTAAPLQPYRTLSVSPDGTRAASAFQDGGNTDVWVSELARGTLTRVTTDEGVDRNPLWSLSGSRVAFESNRNGRPEVFWKSADGSGTAELLLTMEESVSSIYPYDWSPDGTTLFLYATLPETGRDVGMVSIEGPGTWEPLIQTAAEEWAPTLSPNGRWLAYTSDETGRSEVYVQRFPELEDRRPVSVGGGYRPTWSPDGRELLYLRAPAGPPDAAMRVILDIEEGDPPSLIVGTPEPLFSWRYFGAPDLRYYDVSSDGQRFLVIGSGVPADLGVTTPEITVVLNWFEELKARVPVQ